MTRLFSSEAFDTPCRIEIEQSAEHFHAHVELDGNIEIQPGDRVRVHGEPVMVAFGESVVFHRNATVQRAGALRRTWTRFAGHFEMAELYEVSFTPGKLDPLPPRLTRRDGANFGRVKGARSEPC